MTSTDEIKSTIADQVVQILYGNVPTETLEAMLKFPVASATESPEVDHFNAALRREIDRRGSNV
jgi:hypothetical protein